MTTRHVIFGSGPLGRAVARELAKRGHGVRLVSRGGAQPLAGVETLAADVTDPPQAVAASAGADVLYHCMSADYGHWPQRLPPLMAGFIAAGKAAAEILYQAERPWVVDHSRFDAAFGSQVTPHREGLQRTLDWYRMQSAVPLAPTANG